MTGVQTCALPISLEEDETLQEKQESMRALTLSHEIEAEQEQEDEDMMIRLIRVRHALWTWQINTVLVY